MDVEDASEWFPGIVAEEFVILESDFSMQRVDTDCGWTETCVRYANDLAQFEISLTHGEGILRAEIVIPRPGNEPDISLDLNLILEVHGRKDLWITQDDVGKWIGPDKARSLVRTTAAQLLEYGAEILRGDSSIVPEVHRLLADVPGDPRFDWWARGDGAFS